MITIMKKFFQLLIFFSFTFTMAQKKFNFDTQWKEIEKLEQKGLNKSLLASVNEIYEQAKKEQNTPQLIRALFYQSKINLQTSDDPDIELEIIQNFQKEIDQSKGVDQAFLQSILAELYHTYYIENQWNINQRNAVEQSTTDDFKYRTDNIFKKKIQELYLKSLENPKLLKNEIIHDSYYALKDKKDTKIKKYMIALML